MFNIHWRGYRIIAWVGLAALAVGAGVALLQGKVAGAITLAAFLAAGIAFLLLPDDLPNLFDFLFVAAGLINAAGFVWELFHQPGLYDEISHAFTSFSVTLALGFVVYGFRLVQFHGQHWLIIITTASFGISIGALWEVAEWVADLIIAAEVQTTLDDTVTDIILDSVAALAAALVTLPIVHSRAREQEASAEERRAARAEAPGR